MASLDALNRAEYPRSSTYDPKWLVESDMGPNPLWLLEDLAKDLDLRPGMRVLDLGSGKGATSVFLAKEYGAKVWAADLWVPPEDAAATFDRFGVGDTVRSATSATSPNTSRSASAGRRSPGTPPTGGSSSGTSPNSSP